MEREAVVREIKAIWVDDDSYKKVEDCYFAMADLVAASRAEGFREGLEAAAKAADGLEIGQSDKYSLGWNTAVAEAKGRHPRPRTPEGRRAMIQPRNADLPAVGTIWRARDGRLMRLHMWIPGRAKPTATMHVLNGTFRMRRVSEQGLSSFGGFLQPEPQTRP